MIYIEVFILAKKSIISSTSKLFVLIDKLGPRSVRIKLLFFVNYYYFINFHLKKNLFTVIILDDLFKYHK